VYDTFAESLKAGVLPDDASLEHGNVCSRYVFDDAQQGTDEPLGSFPIYPTFHGASCTCPSTGVKEHFLLVGIRTMHDGTTQFRRPLSAIFLLDVSGSMGLFDDIRLGTQTKLERAVDTLLHICETHLRAGDAFAVVLANERATVLQELRPCCKDYLPAQRQLLRGVEAFGFALT
jgi:hypothetical protein